MVLGGGVLGVALWKSLDVTSLESRTNKPRVCFLRFATDTKTADKHSNVLLNARRSTPPSCCVLSLRPCWARISSVFGSQASFERLETFC